MRAALRRIMSRRPAATGFGAGAFEGASLRGALNRNLRLARPAAAKAGPESAIGIWVPFGGRVSSRLQLGNNYFEIPFVCKQRSAAQPEDEPARINKLRQ
jgi:hypothetical protein